MASNVLIKHRSERRLYGIDFAAELADGETLDTVSSLTVLTSAREDVTAEFRAGEPEPTISGSEVKYWLKAASDDEQATATYSIKLVVTTSLDGVIVALADSLHLPRLKVVDS